jgi:hypothetical protein
MKNKLLPSIETVMDAAQADDNSGFCRLCGNHQHGCEPDARNYTCEACGEKAVYGAEQYLLEFGMLKANPWQSLCVTFPKLPTTCAPQLKWHSPLMSLSI